MINDNVQVPSYLYGRRWKVAGAHYVNIPKLNMVQKTKKNDEKVDVDVAEPPPVTCTTCDRHVSNHDIARCNGGNDEVR